MAYIRDLRRVCTQVQSIVVLLFSLATAVQAQVPPTPLDLVNADTRVGTLVAPPAEAGLLSGVILIAHGRQVLIDRAYGFANWELRTPNARETRFGVGSITKAMTQIIVGVLAGERRIDPEAPVADYLRDLPSGQRGGAPTIRHLVTHRAGVPHRLTDARDEAHALTAADIVERVRDAGLLYEPGSRRLYSSAGYTCLARIIEVVEEKAFGTVLAQRVFEPAGMIGAIDETGQDLMPRRAMPHRLGSNGQRVVVKSAPYKDLRFLTGAGSVYATADDLLQFVWSIEDGVFGQGLREQTFGGDGATWSGWYGRANGYEASVDVLPSADLVFVFLSNLQSAANYQVREQVKRILLGQSPGRDRAASPRSGAGRS